MINPIYRLQRWMETRGGQKFMNYAYSWGAAVVILGTLFKLTHIPGANLMLFVGMGTEVFVFFIAGFDLSGVKPRDAKRQAAIDAEEEAANAANAPVAGGTVVMGGGVPTGGVVVIGGAAPVVAQGNGEHATDNYEQTPATGGAVIDGGVVGGGVVSGGVVGGGVVGGGVIGTPADLSALTENMDDLTRANMQYVEQLTSLTETLKKVSEQAERLSTDSTEMENLNRTLTGINTIYELQLKSISTQVGTIDSINDQTRRLARQIEELNAIYARMIEAMTTNMRMTNV